MTNSTAEKSCKFIFAIAIVALTVSVKSEPMDVEAAKQLPAMERILGSVVRRGSLNDRERESVKSYFSSSNGVVGSLAAWIVAQSQDVESNLCFVAVSNLVHSGLMARAHISMIPLWKGVEGQTMLERRALLDSFVKDANPYLRVEAAKQIYKDDSSSGEKVLHELLSDRSAIVRGEAFRILDIHGVIKDETPELLPDEEYEVVLNIREKWLSEAKRHIRVMTN